VVARDEFLNRRGLPTRLAIKYLGVRERVWENLRRQLTPVKLDTAWVYDRRDLDALFDRLKAGAAASKDVVSPLRDRFHLFDGNGMRRLVTRGRPRTVATSIALTQPGRRISRFRT
jgi:hypothetical protein